MAVATAPELIPARMLNEFAYCPRLCYLEWVQGEFADSADTLEGRFHHRQVDRPSGDLDLPPAGDEESPAEWVHARSVTLSDEGLGVIARMDLVEVDGAEATPVEYKRGNVPDVPGGSYEPERVQLCAQGLLLRSHGYKSHSGILYFAGSRRRVEVKFDDDLVSRTEDFLRQARDMAESGTIPPPLEDSPKCNRCSLAGICLPDEVTFLKGSRAIVKPDDVRRISPARADALPLYVQTQGAAVGKSGDELTVRSGKDIIGKARFLDVSSLSVFGNVQITAQAMRELLARDIPVAHFSYGGWLNGITTGMTHKNVELRIRQFQVSGDADMSLRIARDITAAKIRNSRVMLRRNHPSAPATALKEMERLAGNAAGIDNMPSLLGIEGAAARVYFSNFGGMIKTGDAEFDFHSRNRRPPKDPVNAVLSFLYSMLARQSAVSALAVGFDPFLGFYHQPKYGRPALALDLAEEFRPIVADSVALTLFNNGELKTSNFVSRSGGTALTADGRRTVIQGFERRLETLIRHPLFSYSVSYRRIMEIQARLLGRYLTGELPGYPAFTTR